MRLTSDHINAAQVLLHQQFPTLGGLQSTLLDQTSSGFQATTVEAIQIHHTRTTDHWVVSSTIEQRIRVIDSLFDYLSDGTKTQLCELYGTNMTRNGFLFGSITLSQMQYGADDCGLFAIANALELASGTTDFSQVKFDQSAMRHHLIQCFENGVLTAFPRATKPVHMKGGRVFYIDVEKFARR